MDEQISAAPGPPPRSEQAPADEADAPRTIRSRRSAQSSGRRVLLPVALVVALAVVSSILGAQYVLALQAQARLEQAKNAGSAFLSVPTPDATEAEHQKVTWELALGTAVAGRVPGQPDWQVVERLLALSREVGVTVQMEGIHPSKVVKLNGVEYQALPFALTARGNAKDLWLFLSAMRDRFEALDIQRVSLTEDGVAYRLRADAVVYHEPALAPNSTRAPGADVAPDGAGVLPAQVVTR